MMPSKDLVSITGWTNKRLHLKDRMKKLKELDHRMTESRIVEEAVLAYLPSLEYRLLSYGSPDQVAPGTTKESAR